MKTKDLIAQLQAADPTGELECCIGNSDVWYVYREIAYWDGCLQVLKRNPDTKYYNVIGGEYRSNGEKVVIRELSLFDAILNDSEVPITYETDYCKRKYEKLIEEERELIRKIDKDIKDGK